MKFYGGPIWSPGQQLIRLWVVPGRVTMEAVRIQDSLALDSIVTAKRLGG